MPFRFAFVVDQCLGPSGKTESVPAVRDLPSRPAHIGSGSSSRSSASWSNTLPSRPKTWPQAHEPAGTNCRPNPPLPSMRIKPNQTRSNQIKPHRPPRKPLRNLNQTIKPSTGTWHRAHGPAGTSRHPNPPLPSKRIQLNQTGSNPAALIQNHNRFSGAHRSRPSAPGLPSHVCHYANPKTSSMNFPCEALKLSAWRLEFLWSLVLAIWSLASGRASLIATIPA
jgi:hypothetical protein